MNIKKYQIETLKKACLCRHFENEVFKRIKNIPFNVYLKIFYDSGAIWKYEKALNSRLNNTYLYSFGIGLDIVTIKNISLRTELSRNKNKETNLSFNLGADF